ncbi:MAG TPA: L-threonylcarbamoyladenylate synthase [Polyangiaceae bacterium]|jgi:L-threonylcarbamoyladenylate synthase|nr:L-threonylcarbamoyladenylate synthase [Polyangiaceae bacterium]
MFELEISHVLQGGVLAIATESWFALVADARQPQALDALFAMKGRAAEHAVALMVGNSERWLELVCEPEPLARAFAERFWPGPLTLVVPARADLDPRLLKAGSVGVRVPGASPALEFLRASGAAVTATSANLAGEPPCANSDEVCRVFGDWIASGQLRVVKGQAPGGLPSTLVQIEAERFTIVRPGAITRAELEAVAERLV